MTLNDERRNYKKICLEKLKKLTKDFSQYSRFQNRDFKSMPPEYEAMETIGNSQQICKAVP
jgi:hypothetical protein